ncbi:uncharacterized protein G2W53_029467 [Senna tora]|uniref:Uncharacterized protein n=1 Tax=Senna tora TaxID=362788 RepID=A0A834T359_9FABA|nr:uncharacterized protein G2W53_029467 [Senna tora]
MVIVAKEGGWAKWRKEGWMVQRRCKTVIEGG